MALIGLAPLPFLWLSTVKFCRRIRTVSRKTRATERRDGRHRLPRRWRASARGCRRWDSRQACSGSFAGANDAALTQDVKAKRLAAGLERLVDLLLALGHRACVL